MLRKSGFLIKFHRPLNLLLLILLGFSAGFFPSFLYPDVSISINDSLQDLLFHIRYWICGQERISPDIINIQFTESTYAKMEKGREEGLEYPVSVPERYFTALLLSRLMNAGPASVTIDFIFTTNQDTKTDRMLVNVVKDSGKVYFPVHCFEKGVYSSIPGEKIRGAEYIQQSIVHPVIVAPGAVKSVSYMQTVFPDLARHAAGFGHVNLSHEFPLRRVPLFLAYHEGLLPTLLLQQLCRFYHVNLDNVECHFGKYILIKNASVYPGLVRHIKIPVNRYGQVRLNFPGPWRNSFFKTEVCKVLSAKENEFVDMFENKLVFLSNTSSRGKDYGPGIFDAEYPHTGIHLTLATMILTENFLYESGLLLNTSIVIVLALILLLSALFFRSPWFSLFSFIIFILFFSFTFFLFISCHHLTPILEPGAGILLSSLFIILYNYRCSLKDRHILASGIKTLGRLTASPQTDTLQIKDLHFPQDRDFNREFLSLYISARMQRISGLFIPGNRLDDFLIHAFSALKAAIEVKDLILLEKTGNNDWEGRYVLCNKSFFLSHDTYDFLTRIDTLDGKMLPASAEESVFFKQIDMKSSSIVLGLCFPIPASDLVSLLGREKEILTAFFHHLVPGLKTCYSFRHTKDMFNMIIHEIKNTSSSVEFMLSRIVKEVSIDRNTVKQLSLIIREMEKLYQFSTKHLDIEILKRTQNLKTETVPVSRLMEEIFIRYKYVIQAKSITLYTDIDDSLSITGDESYLNRLFSNILENAVMYSPNNSGIWIKAATHNDTILCTITDEGPGFNPRHYKKKKGDSRIKHISHGLGLHLARLIVKKHNGRMEIKDNYPAGTVVCIYLPV